MEIGRIDAPYAIETHSQHGAGIIPFDIRPVKSAIGASDRGARGSFLTRERARRYRTTAGENPSCTNGCGGAPVFVASRQMMLPSALGRK